MYSQTIKNNIMVYIIVAMLEVNGGDARRFCEHMEDRTFDSLEDAETAMIKEGALESDFNGQIGIWKLTDFMDAVNDEELDVLTQSFISYININK